MLLLLHIPVATATLIDTDLNYSACFKQRICTGQQSVQSGTIFTRIINKNT